MNLHHTLTELQSEFLAYAWHICRNEDDAKDLLQNAITRALSSKNKPDTSEEVKPWMFRIIRNYHIDDVRKSKVRMEYLNSHTRLYDGSNAQPASQLEIVIVRQAFDALPADKRDMIYLVDLAGMKYAEVAEIMDIPVGTVMSRISRARKELLVLLGKQGK